MGELTADLAGTGVVRNPSADSMAEVVEDIGSLVDKSLVTVLDRSTNGERFGMLEAIRDFALECLRATDEHEAIRFRHTRWYLHLAETTDVLAAVRNSEHVSLDRIASELDNFRAALAWFDDTRQTGELARLCVELGAYWHARNHLAEGYGWARKVIETHDLRTIPVPLRIKLLHSTGRDAWHLGSFTEASTYLNAALSLAREAGDIGAELSALLDLGVSAEMQGDDLSAYGWFQLVLDGHREHGNPRGILVALTNLGDAAYRLGNIADAIRMSTEALRLADSFSDRDLACLVRGNLGQIALVQDDVRAAWQHYQEEMRLALTTHHDLFLADGLAGMAGVALIQNRARECGLLLGASHAFRERFGARRVPHHLIEDRTATGLRALVPAETMESLLAQGSAFTIADALAVVDRLELQEPVIVANPGLTSLSEREAVVLQLLALGKTDRAIGSDLYISHRTVMRHVAAIFRKLGVNNRAAAAHIANGQVLD